LLLVVFPNSLQYDINQTPSFYEDHLLERVSLLELRQAQMAEALNGMVEILREQSLILKDERDVIKELYSVLGLLDGDEAQKIRKSWDEVLNSKEAIDGPDSLDAGLARIVADHAGESSELVVKLVNESRRLFASGSERQALQMLERARLISPRNTELHIHYGFELFVADRFEKAAEILEAALAIAPDDRRALLLSGVVYAEMRRTDQAKRCLSLIAGDVDAAKVVNLLWAMIAALRDNWTEAIAALKQCAAAEATAEIEYLIGCAYFQLHRYPMALKHLLAATRLDPNYSDAWFMQSLVFRIKAEPLKESETFERAVRAAEPNAQCSEFIRGKTLARVDSALPFRHFSNRKNTLLSGGATRLRGFCRELVRLSIEVGRTGKDEG
jgi:tetratricopeptide (TPR) repeat protein